MNNQNKNEKKDSENYISDIAKDIGFNLDSTIIAKNEYYEYIFSTISKTLSESSEKFFDCIQCGQKYRIPNAREEKIYKCPHCNIVLNQLSSDTIKTIQSKDAELILDETIPEEVQVAMRKPENIFGRFVLCEKIGEGGMGTVWRAFDVELSRFVALKFIKSERAEQLKSEAKTLASLQHKNIARIYDIGTFKKSGKQLDTSSSTTQRVGFIAIELIGGKSLDKIRLNERQSLTVICSVCDAIEYAHNRGVIHRDIKPDNILLDEDNNVFVADFGLAVKEAKGGEFAGTPSFMAPEIGSFEPVSVQSDVYSLTATLYWLLTQKFPITFTRKDKFSAVLEKVKKGAYTSIKSHISNISNELEAIINKGMAKDKTKRYASVRELKEDIQNYLNNYPVRAYGYSIPYRFRKWIKRNRKFAITLSCGLLILIVVGAFAISKMLKEKEAQKEKERLMKQKTAIEQEKEKKEKSMQEIAVEFLNLMSECYEEAKQKRMEGKGFEVLNKIPERTLRLYNKIQESQVKNEKVHYALGKLYRMLGNKLKAKEQQEIALQINPHFTEALYELGVLVYHEYRNFVNAKKEEWKMREILKSYETLHSELNQTKLDLESFKNPTDEDIEKLYPEALKLKEMWVKSFESALKNISKDSVEYVLVEAVFDFARGNLKNAKEKFKSVIQKDKTSEDAVFFLVQIYKREDTLVEHTIAKKILTETLSFDKGNVLLISELAGVNLDIASQKLILGMDDTIIEFDESLNCYNTIIDVLGWKNDEYYIGRGWLLNNKGIYLESIGKDPTDVYYDAIKNFDNVIESNKSNYAAFLRRGTAYINLGLYKFETGKEAFREYELAIKDLTEAIKLNSNNFEVWATRGVAYTNISSYKRIFGLEPSNDIELAISDLSRAIELNEKNYELWKRRGSAYIYRGLCQADSNKDPSNDYKQAIKDFDKSLTIFKEDYKAWMYRGMALINLGKYKAKFGYDPTDDYLNALQNFDKAVELNEKNFETWMNRGHGRMEFIVYKMNVGIDPTNDIQLAMKDFDKAINLNERYYKTWMKLGKIYFLSATYKWTTGKDPNYDFELSVKNYNMTLDLNKLDYGVWIGCGDVYLSWGVYRYYIGEDPSKEFELAIDNYSKAIELNEKNYDAWKSRGMARSNYGRYKERIGKDPLQEYKSAFSDYEKAMKLNEQDSELWMNRGVLQFNICLYKSKIGENPFSDYELAIKDFSKALEINVNNYKARIGRAMALVELARLKKKNENDPTQEYQSAIRDYDEALKINPRDAQIYFSRGFCLFEMGKYSEAIADFVKGDMLNPTLTPRYKKFWEEAQKRLQK